MTFPHEYYPVNVHPNPDLLQWDTKLTTRLAAALLDGRTANPEYPPPRAGTTRDDIVAWLNNTPAVAGFTIDHPDTGNLVGYAQLEPAEPYLTQFLNTHLPAGTWETYLKGSIPTDPRTPPLLELGRVFVHPQWRGYHFGRELVTTATAYAHTLNVECALVVIRHDLAPEPPSEARTAYHLYRTLGWQNVGVFNGLDGVNQVMLSPLPPQWHTLRPAAA